MIETDHSFHVRLAKTEADRTAVFRLRYEVFVEELGGDGPLVDHAARLERDSFDAVADHLMLLDGDRVVGVYRLISGQGASAIGRFYSEDEYDLGPLRATGRRLLELGRSCLHPDYRGGTAMFHLWNGLADHVIAERIEILFGVASFHGTDPRAIAGPLSYLHHHHLAPPGLRVVARAPNATPMDLVPAERLDRRAAMLATPALIKAYLRLGGFVGQGAWIDREFNTIDVCLVMDTAKMNERHRNIYARGKAQG